MRVSAGGRLLEYALIALVQGAAAAGGSSGSSEVASRAGYGYGQLMPVTCLNRTIDSGEHITDNLGKLQYIPFPTCNETFLPLALRYGVSETVNCTINSLPDELYHLLEYYVHSDVPMTCRVPTAPLIAPWSSYRHDKPDDTAERGDQELSALADQGPSYTPITFALQGTLQKSHLHIWTDMNVLLHNIDSVKSGQKKQKQKKSKKGHKDPGFVVAGTAYSVPEFEEDFLYAGGSEQKAKHEDSKEDPEKEAAAVAELAQDPWTAGHGTKVIRGEPLTFTFHVSWVEGAQGIGWPGRSASASASESSSAFSFSRLVLFFLAASVGALMALYWERNAARRRGWRGDGILGVPPRGKGSVGIAYGNGGRMNGYGGYSASAASSSSNLAAAGAGGGGYGGWMTGKRD